MKAFISYSRKDEWALERLHTHLAMLRREGSVAEWFDREILAGGPFDAEISEQLEACDLFLPLVSPDYLNSDYCYEREMTRALERHEVGDMRVVPIIIEPCDWKASPLRALKALPRDGKPVTEWTNQNNAFMDIVTELRRVLAENDARNGTATAAPQAVHLIC
ncbi:MAG: toll/interleukin-1 receptor domain-containing protein [Methylocella sp.]